MVNEENTKENPDHVLSLNVTKISPTFNHKFCILRNIKLQTLLYELAY